MKNQDFSIGKFVLMPKFAGLRQNSKIVLNKIVSADGTVATFSAGREAVDGTIEVMTVLTRLRLTL